ncbi:MAG: S-layer y domain protein [Firmicutes bacterium]|nr:S-layer y domain protein [Bacillota bacterium]
MKKSVAIIMLFLFVMGFAGMGKAAEMPTDVPLGHWAYAAVKKLADDGIVNGDNSRFSGDKPLTRFEFAVIVARAMSKADKAGAEDKALLEKLVVEYQVELKGLGIRVSALENQNSETQIFGTTRLRFDQQSAGSVYDDKHINIDLLYVYKLPCKWILKIENEWQRSFAEPSLGNTAGWNALDPDTNSGIDSQMEQMSITGSLGETIADFGQFKYKPAYGLVMDTNIVGARVTFGNVVKTSLTAANTLGKDGFSGMDIIWPINKKWNVMASYQEVDDSGIFIHYGSLGFDTKLGNDVAITAVMGKSNKADANKAYFSKLQYKEADSNIVGSSDIFFTYKKVPADAVYYTTKDQEDRILDINFKGVRFGFDYVPLRNAKLTLWCMDGKNTTTTADIKIYRGQMEFYF